MLYSSIPAFEDCVHEQSRIFLSHKDCACCGKDMQGRPFGMIGVSVSAKSHIEGDRHYFPLYHLVCESCFDLVYYWDLRKVTREYQFEQPSWSHMWCLTYEHRPCGLASLHEEDSLTDLFVTMDSMTSPWEEFSEVSGCDSMEEFVAFI
jgi:hypothetical protein